MKLVIIFVVMTVMSIVAIVGWSFLVFGGWPAVVICAGLLGIAVYIFRQAYYAAVGRGK